MKREINSCEVCEKETKDYYEEIGWIHLDEDGICITGGREKDEGMANVLFYNNLIKAKKGQVLDFCSIACFLNYIFGKFNNSEVNSIGSLITIQKEDSVKEYLNYIIHKLEAEWREECHRKKGSK